MAQGKPEDDAPASPDDARAPEDPPEKAKAPGGRAGALVKRGTTAPARTAGGHAPPPLVLAPSLAEARPRSFVHVDGKGQVRSPARYKALQAVSYGAAGAIVAGVTVVYGSILGLPGILVGLGLGAWIGWHVRRRARLQTAARLLVHDRLDEAEQILQEVLRSFRLPRTERALAEQNLAAVFIRRGDFEEALRHQRLSMQLYAKAPRAARTSPFARAVEYAEIVTLVNLGRTGEGRQRLDQKSQLPEGDYLRLQHWAAELYVCFAEGEHRFSDDELHERSRVALGITGAAGLLGLCAWAWWSAGDMDEAWHLLGEAYDRKRHTALERALPLLWEWMEAHREEAGIESPPPEDEE